MLDLLTATAVMLLFVAAGLAALYAVTVLPFVVTLARAERQGEPAGRFGLLAAAGIVIGLLATLLVLTRLSISPFGALGPLLLTWAGPLVLWLVRDERGALGGAVGRHEGPA